MGSVERSTGSVHLSEFNGSELMSQSKSDTEVRRIGSNESRDLSDVDENYSNDKEGLASGLTLPRLRDSMTPWRVLEKPVGTTKYRRGRSNTSLDVLSPVNSRPATRNSLFSVDGAYTVTSSSASNEFDCLQKQLTTYKLKVRALLELIKQFNYGGEGLENNESFYKKILSTIAHDEDIEELKNQLHEVRNGSDAKSKIIADLKDQLADLDGKLAHTKEEYAETLEYANEYIGLNDQITTCIDEMLKMLIENLELSPEERNHLEETRRTSSEYAVAKMNALTITLGKTLDDLKNNHISHQGLEQSKESMENEAAIANSTRIDLPEIDVSGEKNAPVNDSAMDTRFEMAIEDMHEQYDSFVKGIQRKLDKSAELESALSDKLAEQAGILEMMRVEGLGGTQEEKVELQKHTSLLTSMDDLSRHASIDLSKSYQDHVDSLNNLVQTLKSTVTDKTYELQNLKEQLRNQEKLRKSEQRSREDLQTLKEISKQKEITWEEFISDLEKSIDHLQSEKEELLKESNELNETAKYLKKENIRLEDALQNASRTSEVYNEQRSQLTHELKVITDELVNIKDENNALHKLAFNVEVISSTVQKQESEFQKFQGHLLLHLDNIFKTLSKILQKKSIEQSKRKLQVLYRANGLSEAKIMQPKLESLYNFIETALESIVESYMVVILTEKDKVNSSKGHEKEMQLRIEELERKWVSERERRKLDSNAADMQISKLEAENEALREKLYNMTIR